VAVFPKKVAVDITAKAQGRQDGKCQHLASGEFDLDTGKIRGV
jgi:hypothetical protein